MTKISIDQCRKCIYHKGIKGNMVSCNHKVPTDEKPGISPEKTYDEYRIIANDSISCENFKPGK